ncbi:MAG: TIGR01777 family oxidoreductase [Desulfobacterales bacterium]|nr:MAG: TIGR01777 family oxidoreductase [Desulfobacterales bacterium]
MKIFITGGAGFIGTNLARYLLSQGHHVTAVGRPSSPRRLQHENWLYIAADTTQEGPWQDALQDTDAVVNLAGASIFKRWTAGYKKRIYDSRILTTRNLVKALPDGRQLTLCSASGAGYYGNRADDILKEDEPPGDDFLAAVAVDWEKEAWAAAAKGVQVVMMRFGVVLGRNGGALAKMIPAYKSFLGGPIGDGRQWFSWIHVEDVIAAIVFAFDHPGIRGPVNFGAPQPVTNRDLAESLGQVLKRPSFMPAPAFMIRLALGEFGSVLLASQRIVPDKLLSHGFQFSYPNIKNALQAAVK